MPSFNKCSEDYSRGLIYFGKFKLTSKVIMNRILNWQHLYRHVKDFPMVLCMYSFGVCTYVAICTFIFDMNMSNFIDEITLTKKNKWKDKNERH